MKMTKLKTNKLKLDKFEVARFEGSAKILGGGDTNGGQTRPDSSIRCVLEDEE